jgi:NAD(P)-dependent dehydrogenase (short-subunit alcohol dehydrogenase family)
MLAQGSGSIISIGSIAGVSSLGRAQPVYGMAIAAVVQMTRALSTESPLTRITCFRSSPSSVPRHGSKAFLADFRESLSGLFSVCLLMRTRRSFR